MSVPGIDGDPVDPRVPRPASVGSGRSGWPALTVVAVIAIVSIAWIAWSVMRGPHVHLQGWLDIASTNTQTCLFLRLPDAGTVWTIVGLPPGYSIHAGSQDLPMGPGGRITGPDGWVAVQNDAIEVDGVPMAASDDGSCGRHPAVSATTLSTWGIGP